ncbi:hypothetical protein CJD36_008355 [Flavipsychrobacter stenotrophus]|uniref:Uncharacterized protein n=2 Tax=Flavipsychrobacter stenotrophus TaxID=2077091 RepID=A0A2S7SZ52_9BACT|nr:hypothetical protein CJD36_008355 [Flavipsychrobacter stenotrophus]
MDCECEFCKNKLPFDVPSEIVDAAVTGNLVIFAGAGISTETNHVFKETLYQDIRHDLNVADNQTIDFPNLMSQYCKQRNGRKLLLEKIRKRFEYCLQFKELYRTATSFHEELSSVYSIESIFTTNWDDYFERECNAIPIVTAQDFAFYNTDGRKIYKLHGSIGNYGSIIATTEDYLRCYKNLRSGLIGSHLKTILATKVVVFIGFSFSDFDFNKIYSYLKKEMQQVIPHCYIVTLDETFSNKFSKEKATIINTDGTYFVSTIRKHLEGIKFLIPKERLQTVRALSDMRSEIHEKSVDFFLSTKTPTAVYNLFYQDGLQHAFDFLEYHSKSGRTFNPTRIINAIKSYENLKSEYLKWKNYPDYVYVEGYISGLYSILADEKLKEFPFFYIMGLGMIGTEKQFKSLLKKQHTYHKTADIVGNKHFNIILQKESQVVPHHRPFI